MYYRDAVVADVDNADPLVMVDRAAFDARLLDGARSAGCRVLTGRRATSVDAAAGRVRLSGGEEIEATMVIGADGVTGVARRALLDGRFRADRRLLAFGLVSDVPRDRLTGHAARALDEGCTHIYFGDVAWGYGWLFPRGRDASIGIAGLVTRNGNLRPAQDALLRRCCGDAARDLPIRGQALPGGNFLTHPARGRLLLVGDAAGLAEPVTGEGIRFAVDSACLAADAVAASLAENRPDRAAPRYADSLRRDILPTMRHARLSRWLLYPRPCLPLAMRTLRRHKSIAPMYLHVLAGLIGYPEFFTTLLHRAIRRHRA
jgi:flavin-dependent dehydrogenase